MAFKLPKPKRRVNEKMTLEALHKSAETYMEMYDSIRKKNDILQKQLDIALDYLATYKQHGTGWVKAWALECEQNIEELTNES